MTVSDRDYLMDAVALIFPELNIQTSDIESSWAGLRPLINEAGKGLSQVSRKDEIWKSDSGLLTIAGGKLTGYRKMAETIVDSIASELQQELGRTFPPFQHEKHAYLRRSRGGSETSHLSWPKKSGKESNLG